MLRPWTVLVGLALVTSACGSAAAETSPEVDASPSACPITVPAVPGLQPPAPYPATPSIPDAIWYGSPELWTVLPADGSYLPRKSVWWSERFGGGKVEETPEITVTYKRLDAAGEPAHVHASGTNAYTVADGWFMMAGLDPQEPGCWQVTAEYRGAVVTYVYEIPETG